MYSKINVVELVSKWPIVILHPDNIGYVPVGLCTYCMWFVISFVLPLYRNLLLYPFSSGNTKCCKFVAGTYLQLGHGASQLSALSCHYENLGCLK